MNEKYTKWNPSQWSRSSQCMVPCHASNVEGDVNERQTRLLGNTVVEQLWQQLNSFSSSYSRYTQVIRLRFPCGIASLAQVSTMGLCPLLSHCNCRPVAKPVLEGITRAHTQALCTYPGASSAGEVDLLRSHSSRNCVCWGRCHLHYCYCGFYSTIVEVRWALHPRTTWTSADSYRRGELPFTLPGSNTLILAPFLALFNFGEQLHYEIDRFRSAGQTALGDSAL